MYKNQLQELAQRSCFNLPAYSCIREGPDHAPRFKATVNFNGEIFESPTYCSTLRQAEHAAAEVALNTLSKRGPSQWLAASILDETGVCKNLLQETAQRAGVSLPVYTTIRSGPGHLPVFQCIVEVAGRTFVGEAAKTKKQAEKNAAMAAWSAIKQLTSQCASSSQAPLLLDYEANDELNSTALALYRREDRTQNMPQIVQSPQLSSTHNFGGRTKVRIVNVKDRNRLSREGSPAGQFHPASSACCISGDMSFEAGQSHGRYMYNQQSTTTMGSSASSLRPTVQNQRSPSMSSPESQMLLSREALAPSWVIGGSNTGRVLPSQQQRRVMRSERFEVKQPSVEELRQGLLQSRSERPLQSRSERFEFKQPLVEQLQQGLLQSRSERPLQSRSERFELRRPSMLQLQQGMPQSRTERSLQTQSERFELRRPLTEELLVQSRSERFELRTMEEELQQLAMYQSRSERPLQSRGERSEQMNMPIEEQQMQQGLRQQARQGRPMPSSNDSFGMEWKRQEELQQGLMQSRSERAMQSGREVNDAAEAHRRDEDEWVRRGGGGEARGESRGGRSSSSSIWARSAQWWGATSAAAAFASTLGLRPPSSLAPPVRVRPVVAVCSAPPPPPRPAAPAPPDHDHQAAARHLFNQLRL